ncbi:hypothetical protein BOX15_Mlig030470g3 [Macrostomum lignano]|uniref:Uncharacterized protein n=1 Tax=Macrostomum lignano TaxID=282301 RepID=A0A267DFZ6_9PLAT|nr:hypothetical protein BOX15_Mlig030470g3 [Macrostomum lignano]
MVSVAYDCVNLNHTIDKVAKWMATSDSQVCLFADDNSVSILSSPSTTNSAGEQGRQVLIDRLKSDAVSRMKSLLRSTASQENNHNEFKRKSSDRRAAAMDACSSNSSGATPNRNQNNEATAPRRSTARKTHSDSRHRRQSQPSNSHSVAMQRKDSGDGSGDFKEDKYLERIIERATQEIRVAIYKLSAENKLPEKCHLKMKLSIKPQRAASEANSPKEQHGRHRGGARGSRGEDEGRQRVSNSERHRTSGRDGEGRSDREKRASSTSNKREHRQQRKDKRKH